MPTRTHSHETLFADRGPGAGIRACKSLPMLIVIGLLLHGTADAQGSKAKPDVTISPASASISVSQTLQFTAPVAGTTNTGVTWSLTPKVGTISTTGLYTAPAYLDAAQTITITVTTVDTPRDSASASLTIAPAVSVSLSPAAVFLQPAQTQQFTANTGVTWSLSSAVGTISTSGLYTAPATLSSTQSVTVKATSIADPTKSSSATVTITPSVTVSMTPATASLQASQTQQFSATVGGTTATGVTWSLSSAVGTISTTGLYTAPATLSSPQTVTVKATSIADPTKSAGATVTITPSVTISLTPGTVSLLPSQTQQFSATVAGATSTGVTWSLTPTTGTISSTGTYTAPASITSTQSVAVTATSVADPTKSASATVVLNAPITVSLTPANATLTDSQSQLLNATVIGTTNNQVTWSLDPDVGGIATTATTAVYVAPSSITSPQDVKITATSMADHNSSASALLSLVQAVTLTIGPSSVTLTPGGSQQFQVTVTGLSNPAVTWALNPAVGSISSGGLYTAPSSISSSSLVTLTATSAADTTKTASTSITLSPSIQTLATFQLAEMFGVSWPDQPIEFRYDGGRPAQSTTRMLGPNGIEVPYQWVSTCSDAAATKGCILVRSSLPAKANYTWTLQSGIAPAVSPVNPVVLNTVGNNYEVINGLTGVRIVTAAGNTGALNLAPIQGIRLPSGTWTGASGTANLLYTEASWQAGDLAGELRTAAYTVTSYSVQTIESGPLKTVLQANYTLNRPHYSYGPLSLPAAGPGHYTVRITIYSNSKSVLIDEDSDVQFSYYLPIHAQIAPNVARWKGHNSRDLNGIQNPRCGYDAPLNISGATNATPIVVTASSSLPMNATAVLISGILGNTSANGTYWAKTQGYSAGRFALYSDSGLSTPVSGNGTYSSGGTVKPAYQGWAESDPAYDAFVDLDYTTNVSASYGCTPGTSYRKLTTSYPPASPSGAWYWEFYQSGAGSSAPVVGMFSGDFSTAWFSGIGPSMPGAYTSNAHWTTGSRAAGIQVDNLLRGPDGRTVTGAHNYSVHRNWGIFVSTQADLLPPTIHQPIQDEQNSLTGINLSRIYTYQLVYPDPPGGWKWQYLSDSGAGQLIGKVRNGTSACGSTTCYYDLLYRSESSVWGRALLDMWKGNSQAAVQAALDPVVNLMAALGRTLAFGDNHFASTLGYYQLGLQTGPATSLLNAILMDANASPAQKTLAKAALGLFGCLFWDNDWFPIENISGDGGGLTNQVAQYYQNRTQAVGAAPSQPYLASKLPMALTYPMNDFNSAISPTGAPYSSTHYENATFQPLVLNFMNYSKQGILTMSDPKWAAYANWELSIQTPPEPRFGNLRKGYSNGDGNTEADVRTGMLATLLNSVNPTLAGNLMWAWQQSSSNNWLTEDSQFVSTLTAIDPSIAAIVPALGSINVPGYHTAERHNFGTANETALWFINGDFYSLGGHRHYDDGQVSIYAHSAPLAIDWNANLYNPKTPGRFFHNSIVLDSEIGHSWNADNAQPEDVSLMLSKPTNTEYVALKNSTHSVAKFAWPDGTVWTRSVRMMSPNASYPIIYVTDTFAGSSAAAAKTMTWQTMANGAVTTPAGVIIPTTRFSAGCQSPAGAYPSAGAAIALSSGLQAFHFTGAVWPAHATGGIDWDLYQVPSSGSARFLLGNWGHGCHAGREASEYQGATGTSFAETQHILRVNDTGSFTTIILPYRKGEAPTRAITQQSCGTQIVQGSESTCFNGSAATYTDGTKNILSVYDGSSQAGFGIAVSGGPQEVTLQPGKVVWTISGINSGTRSLTLPGTWSTSQPLSKSGSTYSYPFAGGAQAPAVTIVFTQQ